MKRVIIVGSPRSNGRSAHLAEMLFEANIDERPEDELFLVPVSEIEVGFCIGCNACRQKSEVIFKNDDGDEVSERRHRCVFDDDMQTVYDLLDEADVLTVVSPVYFSGAPAPMKCLIDRLQPYFWEYRENGPRLPKRPLDLHVIGEGGDPHGYDPLISEIKGPLALAGFGLERIYDWVGKIDSDGEIMQEAEVREVAAKPAAAKLGASTSEVAEVADFEPAEGGVPTARDAVAVRGGQVKTRPRPKLSFSEKGASGGKARSSSASHKPSAQKQGSTAQGKSGRGSKASSAGGPAARGKKSASRGRSGQGGSARAGAASKADRATSKAKPHAKGKGGHRG